jgi:peptidoglycan/LPS O-acetylase OafA/YrhL
LTHEKQSEIRALTGVRGFAALWVVILHASTTLNGYAIFSGSIPHAIKAGYLAVDLFFVLSGFVLSMTSMRRLVSDLRREILPFIASRIFRLYPLHWFILVLFLIYVISFRSSEWGTPYYSIDKLFRSALLVQVWGRADLTGWNLPAWSIAAEFAAYVMFAPLAIVAMRISRAWVAAVTALLFLVGLALLIIATGSTSLDHINRLGIPRCIMEFSAGVFLWRYVALRQANFLSGDSMLVVGLVIVAFGVAVPAFELIAPVGCLCLVVSCYSSAELPNSLFGNQVAHFFGAISFSIYLDHFLVIQASASLGNLFGFRELSYAARVIWFACQFPVIIALSYSTWRWVELPSQHLGRRFRLLIERAKFSPTNIKEH